MSGIPTTNTRMRPRAPCMTPGGMCTIEPLRTGWSTPSSAHSPFPLEHVVQLRRDAMVMFPRPIDIDRVRPSCDVFVLAADEQMAPAACAALARSLSLVAYQHRSGCG